MIKKYQWGDSLILVNEREGAKSQEFINNGLKQFGTQIKQAESRVNQLRKAHARANKNTRIPMLSNNLAEFQDQLWKIGAFKGVKDRHGKEAIYDTAVDGIEGNMTKTAIANAEKMGYNVSSGTLRKPAKTIEVTLKKPMQAAFTPTTSYVSEFLSNITKNIGSIGSNITKYMSSEPVLDSKNTNLLAIFDHKNRFNVDKNYAVVDKKNNTLSIYNRDKLVSSYPVTLGSNIGDGMMPTNTKYLGDAPRTTGAGVFTLYGRGTSHYTGNEPYYTMRSDSVGSVALALHSPANLTNRREFFRTGKNGRISYGCVSTDSGIMKKIYNDKTLQTGDSIYVLPEVKGNDLVEKNGKLQMQWKGNNPKTYKDSHGITRNFRYNPNV